MNQNDIKSALAAMHTGDPLDKSKDLLATIGYHSDLTLELSGTVDDFLNEFQTSNPNTKTEQHFRENAKSAHIIFQLTKDEIVNNPQLSLLEPAAFDKGNAHCFLFCAVELEDNHYSRTKYAEFTREINKRLFAPTVIIFRAGEHLTIAFADRRPSETDAARDVLGQVTLIKDIRLNHTERDPHRAHLEILSELSLDQCIQWMNDNRKPQNFDGLLAAWLAKLDTEELNKKFYRKLFAWYEWAVDDDNVKFPTDENRVIKREEHVIRLITRLLFIWFIKEKGLIADALFSKAQIQDLLTEDDFDKGDSYYRAVLQNLFFATLNTEIDKRKFSTGGNHNHRNFSKYRYKNQMDDPDKLLDLFSKTPFINGGLFDCLDSFDATKDGGYRIDCFSDKHYDKLSIPNSLFFDKDRGLLPLLDHYKFTVEENTPIDQEVALDPELLGRVFENLLAAINPETGETARKMTGSFYTPRAIVDYMVDEVLVASLSQKCQPTESNDIAWEERLHYLFDYAKVCDDASVWFDDRESADIVKTISQLKILDPAVGSGAFPMGVLHKLTLALRRLDPGNTRWETLQKELAAKRAAEAFDTQDDDARREELHEIDDTFKRYRDSDFGRKLYLIQNSIFGVDIQPIACQIAKLRFFISLAIEQEKDTDSENFGIKPLPNLETRFVAANTLIGINLSETKGLFQDDTVQQLLKEIERIREKFFLANNRGTKRDLEKQEEKCRTQLEKELERQRTEWIQNRQAEIESKIASLRNSEQREQLREKEQKKFETHKKIFETDFENARKIARWKPYDQNAKEDWFDPEWMYGITDGFDICIGNPPYIQLQRDGGRLADLYQPCGFDTFTRMGDIYCLFYEKGHKLLNGTGHLCFITSNKWMRAGYGKKLRDYFILYTQPVQLLDMGPDVFDATVDTNILLMQNKVIYDGVMTFRAATIGADFDRLTSNISLYLQDNGVDMEMPTEGEPWAILSSAEMNLKRKIEEVGTPLRDWDINIYRGIVTGCNEAFIIDEAKREELIEQDPRSAEIIKPLLRGKDIKRYRAEWTKMYLLFIPWHFPLHEDSMITGSSLEAENAFEENYPSIFSHLLQYQDRLSNRNRSETGIRYEWYALQRCANTYYTEFDEEKIVWKRIGSILRFAYIQHTVYCLDSTCIATGKNIKLLTAVLNSPISHYQLFSHAPKTGTGDVIVSVQAIEPILVPLITEANQGLITEIENKVDEIIAVKAADPGADTTDLEDEIDCLVYGLYGLTDDEIAIVEGKE